MSATIIVILYVLFSCGICTAHFPSTWIEVPLQIVNLKRIGIILIYFYVDGSLS